MRSSILRYAILVSTLTEMMWSTRKEKQLAKQDFCVNN